jgi:hypothetical protein
LDLQSGECAKPIVIFTARRCTRARMTKWRTSPTRKVVYVLDDESQDKARDFARQKVKISGQVDSKTKTLHVTLIAAA